MSFVPTSPVLPAGVARSVAYYRLLIHDLFDADGSQCTLTLEEPHGWLRATWRGYGDPLEAMRGAEHYLVNTEPFHYSYLLNDNLALQGP